MKLFFVGNNLVAYSCLLSVVYNQHRVSAINVGKLLQRAVIMSLAMDAFDVTYVRFELVATGRSLLFRPYVLNRKKLRASFKNKVFHISKSIQKNKI